MRSDIQKFEPVYLKDAKRHIEWLYSKVKNSEPLAKEIKIKKKESLFSKVWTLLKKIF